MGKRKIRDRTFRFLHAGIAAILGDAHNRIADLCVFEIRNLMADRIGVRQISVRECLIDNRDFARACQVRILNVAAQTKRNPQGMQESRAHQVDPHRGDWLGRERIPPIYQHAVIVAEFRAYAIFRYGGCVNSR